MSKLSIDFFVPHSLAAGHHQQKPWGVENRRAAIAPYGIHGGSRVGRHLTQETTHRSLKISITAYTHRRNVHARRTRRTEIRGETTINFPHLRKITIYRSFFLSMAIDFWRHFLHLNDDVPPPTLLFRAHTQIGQQHTSERLTKT